MVGKYVKFVCDWDFNNFTGLHTIIIQKLQKLVLYSNYLLSISINSYLLPFRGAILVTMRV